MPWVKMLLFRGMLLLTFHRKATIPDSVFNEVSGIQPAALCQRGPDTDALERILWNFKEHVFIELFQATTSDSSST